MSCISPLKALFFGLVLSSHTLFGQTFSLHRDEKGEVVSAQVNNDDISVKEVEELKSLAGSTLRELRLGEAPEGVDLEKGVLSVLSDFSALEYLHLAKSELRDEDLGFLSKLKALKTLIIQGTDLIYDAKNHTNGLTDRSVEILAALQNLEELRIYGNGDFSDEFVRKIAAFSKLEALTLSSRRFSDQALEAIAANPRLKKLELRSPQFTDSGVQALGRMHTLEELEIDSPQLTQKALHAVAALSRLKVLEFPIKEVDREALAVVAGLKSMERLALRYAVIGDDQFEVLKAHPSLQSFFLNKAKLTEKSAKVLQSLKMLDYGEFGSESWIKKFPHR